MRFDYFPKLRSRACPSLLGVSLGSYLSAVATACSEQIRSPIPRDLIRSLASPAVDGGVVTGQKDVRDLRSPELCRPGVLRILEQAPGVRLRRQRFGVAQHPGDETRH